MHWDFYQKGVEHLVWHCPFKKQQIFLITAFTKNKQLDVLADLDVVHDNVGEDEDILGPHTAGEVGLRKLEANLLHHQLEHKS